MKDEGLKASAHLIISGRVQGVYFRACTREEAIRHSISGWVRNSPDGKVEAHFEGLKDDVQQVVNWCRKGPPSALVTGIELNWGEYSGDFPDFSIRY